VLRRDATVQLIPEVWPITKNAARIHTALAAMTEYRQVSLGEVPRLCEFGATWGTVVRELMLWDEWNQIDTLSAPGNALSRHLTNVVQIHAWNYHRVHFHESAPSRRTANSFGLRD
jgi:hypothetical protein